MGTNCPRSTSYHKRLGVLFSQRHFLCPWNSQLWKANTDGFVFFFVVVGFFCWFFFQEEGRKWNCPFSPLQISFISPCSWFCIRADWFHWKKVKFGHSFPLPNPHLSATASALPTGTDEGLDLTEAGTQIFNFRNALLHLKPELLTTFPNLCGRSENTVLLFVC